jgi:hypothetical protein
LRFWLPDEGIAITWELRMRVQLMWPPPSLRTVAEVLSLIAERKSKKAYINGSICRVLDQ